MLFILLLIALGLCFASNKDIFSPGKFYHLSLTVYFADIFLSEHSGDVYAIYLGLILTGMVMSVVEAYSLSGRQASLTRFRSTDVCPARFILILWLLTLIPVLAQCYMIHLTGGLGSLATAVMRRVADRRGLGWLGILVKLIEPINLLYFGFGLAYRKRRPVIWWLGYGVHLLVFAAVALPKGSRGFVLGQVVLMMVIYNYLRRPVKLRYAVVGGAALLITAAFLGAVRENLGRIKNLDDLGHMRSGTLQWSLLSYGLMQLDVVFERDFTDYQYGKTFLTAATNFVPRAIWPEKFESGGVVLTKFAHGRYYTGKTNMTPGIVTESILNFGYPLGILWAFAFLSLVILLMVRFYTCLLNRISQRGGVGRVYVVALYGGLASVAGRLLVGEFADIFIGLVPKVAFLSIVVLLLRLRLCRTG
ncbi:MAG: hypothetical protein A2Y76_06780 [Planctomycetes bacterium RBG_13_60_9]|nr:MAG: hypothetical protein A2Y76_06780 [Planctomycetes bacterium RBG_13_60_9]